VLRIKDLRGRGVGEKVTGWSGRILEWLEGLPGGWAWFEGTEGRSKYVCYYDIMVLLVKGYFKWFGWREIAGIGAGGMGPAPALIRLLRDAVGFGGFLSRVLLAESRFHWEAAGRARAFSRNPTPERLRGRPNQDALTEGANRFGAWRQANQTSHGQRGGSDVRDRDWPELRGSMLVRRGPGRPWGGRGRQNSPSAGLPQALVEAEMLFLPVRRSNFERGTGVEGFEGE